MNLKYKDGSFLVHGKKGFQADVESCLHKEGQVLPVLPEVIVSHWRHENVQERMTGSEMQQWDKSNIGCCSLSIPMSAEECSWASLVNTVALAPYQVMPYSVVGDTSSRRKRTMH